MEETNIGLDKTTIEKVSEILNKILSDEFILNNKTKNFHWNVEGKNFNDLHKFFEEQYNQINDFIDEIAERIRMLGVYPKSTLKYFLETSDLKETEEILPAEKMILELLKDHEKIIRNIRQYAKDISSSDDLGNEDFLINLLESHEKIAWMLRAMTKN